MSLGNIAAWPDPNNPVRADQRGQIALSIQSFGVRFAMGRNSANPDEKNREGRAGKNSLARNHSGF
jgi:hypothetical protein